MNLLKLQTKIHEQNKSVGWWDDPRPFSTFACLFHSELSEAMEGDRKNLMDDHLPEYEMFWVEVADFVIRCMDWLGSIGNDDYDFSTWIDYTSKTDFLEHMHGQVASCSRFKKDPYYKYKKDPQQAIACAAVTAFEFAKRNNVDLFKIITEKTAYNLTRADHKRENRALDNGKKY